MNFGHVGSRTIFEMIHDQQRALLDHVRELNHYSSSLLAYMVQIKQKDEVSIERVRLSSMGTRITQPNALKNSCIFIHQVLAAVPK